MNLDGIFKLSKERLLDELKKILNINNLTNLLKDKISLELIKIIFPELKYFNFFSKLNYEAKNILDDTDFIFLICLLIIDDKDNADYFLYKFNISKKNQNRIKNIDNFYKDKITSKTFTENNMNKVFYYKGKEAVIDILNYRILKTKKTDKYLIELINKYKDKSMPIMPIKANVLMTKFKILEGKALGDKLKIIEGEWVKNNFQISDQQVENIIKG